MVDTCLASSFVKDMESEIACLSETGKLFHLQAILDTANSMESGNESQMFCNALQVSTAEIVMGNLMKRQANE